jgi:hypothetical protein
VVLIGSARGNGSSIGKYSAMRHARPVPGIHLLTILRSKKDVDGQVKPGDDQKTGRKQYDRNMQH